ncbi:MAG TPA: succinyl-diaminopimelate desuccinylase [Gammaproteobacteria bacterium]|nr:succinyl-diaminopimelate desuccinylase [Gammaproteobacteria bacterium]
MSTNSSTIELARELMSRPSVTPEDGGCQDFIAKILTDAGFTCEKLRFDEVDNLWARIGTDAPLLVFAGHTDVVPTGPESDWTHPPFQPVIHDDHLFGRGASDMKAAVAAMVIAAVDFVKKNKKFNGSIAFLLTSDEEGPALSGTKLVMEQLKKRGEKIDYCIVGEPSSNKTTGDQIRIGRRGSLHGKLIIHGKQGHVAHPHLAVNPIHNSMLALHEIAHEKWDEGNTDFPPTTFQITNVHAGTGAANVIPGHMEITFNFRFSTAVTVDELKSRTENFLNKYKLKYDIKWTIGAEPFLTKKGTLINTVTKTVKNITGLDTVLSTGGGTSDARYIAPTGAEVVELGVPHATAHHVDENVLVSDVEVLTNIYESILSELLK